MKQVLLKGINEAFDEVEMSIKKSLSTSISITSFKTSFTYPLLDSKKRLAAIALEEVRNGIAYTLINVPTINSVTIDEELLGETNYKIEITHTLGSKKQKFEVCNLLINDEQTDSYFITAKSEEVQIIIPVAYDGLSYYCRGIDSSIPRLHLDFPMIGTEDLNLPFIVNSALFEPTEPRDGISLIADEDNETSSLNCSIVIKAVALYDTLLCSITEEENWKDLYNLARIKSPKKHPWIDFDWFKENVVYVIRERLLHIPIVNVEDKSRVSILNENDEAIVFFPHADSSIIRERIWSLLKKIYPQYTPIKKDVDNWFQIVWNDCYKFTLSDLSETIQGFQTLAGLMDSLKGNQEEALQFINDYYELLNLEEVHIKDILSDKFFGNS